MKKRMDNQKVPESSDYSEQNSHKECAKEVESCYMLYIISTRFLQVTYTEEGSVKYSSCHCRRSILSYFESDLTSLLRCWYLCNHCNVLQCLLLSGAAELVGIEWRTISCGLAQRYSLMSKTFTD